MGRKYCLNSYPDGEAVYKLAVPVSAGQNMLDRIADSKNWVQGGLTVL